MIRLAQTIPFNSRWKFWIDMDNSPWESRQPGNADDASQPSFDDSSWRVLDLPHDWSIEGSFDSSRTSATAYLPGGIGWYRKHFMVDAADLAEGGRVRIRFDGVYNHSTVWCNGMLLGHRPYGYSSFSYDLTDCLLPGQTDQLLAVHVDHSEFSESRWYTGSGIFRNVWLTGSNAVHVKENGIFAQTPRVSDSEAEIRVETTVLNEGSSSVRVVLTSRVLDSCGAERLRSESRRLLEAGTEAVFAQTLVMVDPQLWSPESPTLYRLRTELRTELRKEPADSFEPASIPDTGPIAWVNGIPVSMPMDRPVAGSGDMAGNGDLLRIPVPVSCGRVHDAGTLLDERVTTFGIRFFAFHPDRGFSLNGVSRKMKGVCIHHDAGCFGAAVPLKVWARRLRLLKESGCDAIRFSHNPPDPGLLDLCDTMGFLTMDEAFDEWELPKNKWVSGHNQGIPSRQGYADHFAEWWERDLKDMVLRDRNHPSIIFWSIGNEIDYPNDPYTHPVLGDRYKPGHPHSDRLGVVAGKMAVIVRSLDTTRPVTAALADVTISNRTGYADVLDVVGYNYLERHYQADHRDYPGRVIYGSENGQSWDAWTAVRDNPYIFGQFLWTGIDFLGEARGWPVRNSQAGYLDAAGFRKPSFFFRKSLWTEEPMAWLAVLPPDREAGKKPFRGWGEVPSWNWPGREGEILTVVCHTNCPELELIQDGVPVGVRNLSDFPDHLVKWDVAYRPGILQVYGRQEGKTVCTGLMRTSGPAFGIRANLDAPFLQADGMDLVHAELAIVDENGVHAYDANQDLHCSVEGPGRIIGLENGDPASHEPYGTVNRKAFHGRLLVVVQSTGEVGHVTLTVRGDGLEALNLGIPCRESY